MGIKAFRSQAGLLGFIALGLPLDTINFRFVGRSLEGGNNSLRFRSQLAYIGFACEVG